MFTPADILDFVLDRDAASIEVAVDEIMKERINDYLDSRKVEVARELFNQEN
jgi:hypothetical protein